MISFPHMATEAYNSSELTRSELLGPRAKQGHKILLLILKKESAKRSNQCSLWGAAHYHLLCLDVTATSTSHITLEE